MTTPSDDRRWRRPADDETAVHPMFEVADAPTEEADPIDDLDWVRNRIVELDDDQRALAATDLAARHAILQTIDDLRALLRAGHADQLHAVRDAWEARAGRKGEHTVDYEAIAGMVRSMMPSGGSR